LHRSGNALGVIAFCAIFFSYFGYAETPSVTQKELLPAILSANDDLYSKLQSFVCSERIQRFAAYKKADPGKPLDTLQAQVSFENGHEHYSEVKRGAERLAGLSNVVGAWSEGEFGTLLRQTEKLLRSQDIQFDGYGEISGMRTSRLHFDVNEHDSPWDLEVAGRHYRVPFRADVWVDPSSGEIVKIARTSMGPIGDTRIAGLEWSVTLAPVELSGKSWLLPKEGGYSVEYTDKGHREWNRLSFSNYHRYGAEVSLRFDGQD
jgi:hypothetical protein